LIWRIHASIDIESITGSSLNLSGWSSVVIIFKAELRSNGVEI